MIAFSSVVFSLVGLTLSLQTRAAVLRADDAAESACRVLNRVRVVRGNDNHQRGTEEEELRGTVVRVRTSLTDSCLVLLDAVGEESRRHKIFAADQLVSLPRDEQLSQMFQGFGDAEFIVWDPDNMSAREVPATLYHAGTMPAGDNFRAGIQEISPVWFGVDNWELPAYVASRQDPASFLLHGWKLGTTSEESGDTGRDENVDSSKTAPILLLDLKTTPSLCLPEKIMKKYTGAEKGAFLQRVESFSFPKGTGNKGMHHCEARFMFEQFGRYIQGYLGRDMHGAEEGTRHGRGTGCATNTELILFHPGDVLGEKLGPGRVWRAQTYVILDGSSQKTRGTLLNTVSRFQKKKNERSWESVVDAIGNSGKFLFYSGILPTNNNHASYSSPTWGGFFAATAKAEMLHYLTGTGWSWGITAGTQEDLDAKQLCIDYVRRAVFRDYPEFPHMTCRQEVSPELFVQGGDQVEQTTVHDPRLQRPSHGRDSKSTGHRRNSLLQKLGQCCGSEC